MAIRKRLWVRISSAFALFVALGVFANLPACETNSCFAAGTLIATPGGSVAIEELAVGDVVWSYDLGRGVRVPARVTRTFEAEDRALQRLRLGDGQELLVTSEHPFYVDGDWVEAGELTAGVELFHQEAGELHAVELVELTPSMIRGTVYNIEVEGHHNFFAGGVLVHNKSPAIVDRDGDGLEPCGVIPMFGCDCDDTDPAVTDECVPGSDCFAGETLIDTPGGEVEIAALEVGSVVWSYDLEQGVRVPARVLRTFGANDAPLRRLSLGNGHELFVTDEHPFYVGGEWVRAADLVAGTELLASLDGEMSAIPLVQHMAPERRGTVYNIEVEGHHNFFAGGVLVHNKSPPFPDDDGDGWPPCDGFGFRPPDCDCDDSDPAVGNECYWDAGLDAGGDASDDSGRDA